MIYCASHERRHHEWLVSDLPIRRPAPRVHSLAQFLAICRASILVEARHTSAPFSSQSRAKRHVSWPCTTRMIDALHPSTNGEQLSERVHWSRALIIARSYTPRAIARLTFGYRSLVADPVGMGGPPRSRRTQVLRVVTDIACTALPCRACPVPTEEKAHEVIEVPVPLCRRRFPCCRRPPGRLRLGHKATPSGPQEAHGTASPPDGAHRRTNHCGGGGDRHGPTVLSRQRDDGDRQGGLAPRAPSTSAVGVKPTAPRRAWPAGDHRLPCTAPRGPSGRFHPPPAAETAPRLPRARPARVRWGSCCQGSV
jgi:hypothetical protein